MQGKRMLVACVAALAAIIGAPPAPAQDYPARPVRIVTSEPGGALDFVARLIAFGLTRDFGQQVIVENRGGASGIILIQLVSHATPDGYTLMLYGSTLWLLPLLQSVPYDPVRDFAPVTAAVRSPTVLVVHPSVPVNSVAQLIALAKEKPGALNYASSSTGGSAHLAAELFKSMAHVNITRVNYKGNGPAINDLIAGHVQVMFSSASGVMLHVRAGRLRALGVTSLAHSDLLPDLPTVASSGLPGYEATTVYSLFAPAATPRPIIDKLHDNVVRVLHETEVRQKLEGAGVEIVAGTPQALTATMKKEIATMGTVIRDAGIRAE
jgi:tripartite-type tricarboxylate transporter receptor subunit TctC